MRILRSNRKTLSLTVTKEGEVLVRAPYGVSDEYVSDFVNKHCRWIEKRIAARREAPLPSFADGDAVVLFGTEYSIGSGRVGLSDCFLFLPQERRNEAFARFLKKFTAEVMTSFTDRLAARYGFSFSGVRISSARGRWGSCNKTKMIAYSFRIAFLPPDLCEYVAVHELAHTVCFDHSRAFWQIVERALPDWKERRKRLKQYNFVMDYL